MFDSEPEIGLADPDPEQTENDRIGGKVSGKPGKALASSKEIRPDQTIPAIPDVNITTKDKTVSVQPAPGTVQPGKPQDRNI